MGIHDKSLFQLRNFYFFRENGFAIFNGKVNTSINENYQVSSGEVGWDQHTMLNMWGRDMDSLVPDLSTASKQLEWFSFSLKFLDEIL